MEGERGRLARRPVRVLPDSHPGQVPLKQPFSASAPCLGHRRLFSVELILCVQLLSSEADCPSSAVHTF